MIQFDFSEYCCGCTSCANICPLQAISMYSNHEGFLIPVVDQSKCINCGKCDKACPHLNTGKQPPMHTIHDFSSNKAFLYYSKEDARKDSASGGLAYDVSMKILSEGGMACGCIWDKNLKAIHIVSDSEKDIKRMQGSKYVQSDLKNCYTEIRAALKADRAVVFCGTPCQTAGLRQFLGESNMKNLISIGLFCHGVPSPEVWERYKSIIEKKYHGKIADVNMRDKDKKGYKTSYAHYTLSKKDGVHHLNMATYLEDPYIFLFTDDLYLRRSCYHCPYKGNHSQADILIGDFYASIPSAGKLGCSCAISLTPKGNHLMSQIQGVCLESDIYTVGSVNSVLWKSAPINEKRKIFFDRMKRYKNDELSLFSDFLSYRFHIKKILNKMGLFHLIRKLIK